MTQVSFSAAEACNLIGHGSSISRDLPPSPFKKWIEKMDGPMATSKVLRFPTRERERAIRALFPDATPAGDGRYRFCCPGHDDSKPSAVVGFSEDGRRALVKCFAGCSHDDIAKAVGLKNAQHLYRKLQGDATPIHTKSDKDLLRHPTARYIYRDERGQRLYVVQRYAHRGEKTFRPFKPDGTSGLKNVRRVVYRLNELHQRQKSHVYWVEGEKCVRTLKNVNVAATTSVGGASGYKEDYGYAQQLKNAGITAVTILPDHDEPGLAYARRVADDLQTQGLRVKLVELPGLRESGDDVADWLEAGHSARELHRLRKAAARYQSSVDSNIVCLADVEREEVEWVWDPYVPLGKVTLCEGDPGIGKSWLTLNMAKCIAQGDGLPGMKKRKPQRVLLLTAEDGLGDTVGPRLDAMDADCDYIFALNSSLVFNEVGIRELEAAIRHVRPRVVIVDPFVAYLGAEVDMHRANETRAVLRRLQEVATGHRCAIVLVRHLTKSGKDKSIYRGLGSIDITAACRSVLLVGVDPDDEGCGALVHIKSSLAKRGPTQSYTVEDGRFKWTGESTLTAPQLLAPERDTREAVEEAIDFLKAALADGPIASGDLQGAAQRAGISWASVKRARKKLPVLVEKKRDEKKHFTGFRWRLAKRLRANGANGT